MLTLEVTGFDALHTFVQALQAPFPPEAHAEAGGAVQQVWQAAATGTVLPPMTQPVNKPDLAQSVQVTLDGDGATVSADASLMPNGTAARDMKPSLLHGPHSRMGKHGRYNIIPMHHDAASLPAHIVSQLENGTPITSLEGIRSKILNGGAPVLAYPAASGPFQVVSHYTWQTGLYTGMRLGRHPDYPMGPVTFRTVSERSDPGSWWYPAKPGQPLVAAVSQASVPLVTAIYTQWWEARLHAH
ncbi:hypothetical protein [Sulfobacillus harzensis]|uniref:hypothetical protein n=1 Tax=Sulfobacillus harzensis TaxID=2729629 RepID=UPI001A9B8833|nr:hypothetical protein [Sulfobacillus harzensis]